MNEKHVRCFVRWLLAIALAAVVAAGPSRGQGAGETLFKAKCVMCHGSDGKAEVPMGKKLNVPSLVSSDVQKQSDAQLMDAVTKGKNKMPAYDGKLTKEQIAQLVAYVRELGKK
jgi:mono/diheme cytochrome c family protein